MFNMTLKGFQDNQIRNKIYHNECNFSFYNYFDLQRKCELEMLFYNIYILNMEPLLPSHLLEIFLIEDLFRSQREALIDQFYLVSKISTKTITIVTTRNRYFKEYSNNFKKNVYGYCKNSLSQYCHSNSGQALNQGLFST